MYCVDCGITRYCIFASPVTTCPRPCSNVRCAGWDVDVRKSRIPGISSILWIPVHQEYVGSQWRNHEDFSILISTACSERNIHRYTSQSSFLVFIPGLQNWNTCSLTRHRPFSKMACSTNQYYAYYNVYPVRNIVDISTKFDQFGSIWLVVRNVRIQRRVL